MPTVPVPQLVYDAAMRYITRESLADDEERMARWLGYPNLTRREMALEVCQLAYDYGIAPSDAG